MKWISILIVCILLISLSCKTTTQVTQPCDPVMVTKAEYDKCKRWYNECRKHLADCTKDGVDCTELVSQAQSESFWGKIKSFFGGFGIGVGLAALIFIFIP